MRYLCTIDNGQENTEGTGNSLKDAYDSANAQLTTRCRPHIRFFRLQEVEWDLDDKPDFVELGPVE